MTKTERIQKMRRGLLRWFAKNGRDLPWRRTTDPYAIVVSEIMLQQTQVDRVIPKYKAFLAAFPTWKRLAGALQADVVRMWHGLGYNRRAVMLHKLAQTLSVRSGDASLPQSLAELRELPGIGAYTAQAVRAFAFRLSDAAPVDTNIERILKRVFRAHEKTRTEIERLAHEALPTDTWSWNHAMMDLGATVCTARAPKCATCPLKNICASYPCAGDDVRKRPQKTFADSDRMYRGRIVARLRGRSYDPHALQKLVGLQDEERFGMLVDRLMREGLVTQKHGKLFLA